MHSWSCCVLKQKIALLYEVYERCVEKMTDSRLRGLKIDIPKFQTEPLPETLQNVRGYTNLQTFFPTLANIFRLNKFQVEDVAFHLKERIVQLDSSGVQGVCSIELNTGETREAYMKVTHLLDPSKWMQGYYSLPKDAGLPWHNKTWTTAWHKLQDPWNQAYVETVASYALHKLRESKVSPHFNLFYGAYCAKAEVYRYNINDEYGSYRNTNWFWKGSQRGLYSLNILNSENPEEPVAEDIRQKFLTHPDLAENAALNEDELEEISVEDVNEAESLHTASIASASDAEEDDDDEEEDEEDEEDKYAIYADIPNFPVMLLLTENNMDTMDMLLDPQITGCEAGTQEWEDMWSAWIFQVVTALCVMQKVLGMTHNDLHTNNIVWTTTEEEFLYYKNNKGQIWKVPTYGKIFRLIDFGRSIFTINGKMFVSDDFRQGNDAAGQYSFTPLFSNPKEICPPNPSFDLARLAVSVFEALFPERPANAPSKVILSEEEGMVVRESVSPLFNILWTWMVDEEDKNILMEPDGTERYPDFDLYKRIAASCKNACPEEQIYKKPFSNFITEEPVTATCYPLFH